MTVPGDYNLCIPPSHVKTERVLESPFRVSQGGNLRYDRHLKHIYSKSTIPSREEKDQKNVKNTTYLQLKTIYEGDVDNCTSTQNKRNETCCK